MEKQTVGLEEREREDEIERETGVKQGVRRRWSKEEREEEERDRRMMRMRSRGRAHILIIIHSPFAIFSVRVLSS